MVASLEHHARVLTRSASMIQAMIVTQSTAEPIALVSASLNAVDSPRSPVRARTKSVSTTPMMIATRITAEPTAVVFVFLAQIQLDLDAVVLQDFDAQAKTKRASTIQTMTAIPKMVAPIASVSVSAEPTPILFCPFVPRRNLHPAAGSPTNHAPEGIRIVSMTRKTVAIRSMAGPIAQESALVLNVEDLGV